jgi:predicted metal-dependent hydrolase
MKKSLPKLQYLNSYSADLQDQISVMLERNQIADYLFAKYPNVHSITNDAALRDYVMSLKNQYIKKSAPLSKVVFDKKIHVVNNALGLHTFVSRVQGSKLKSKNEIRISSLFQTAPTAFLDMIVVHELAHLKEKEHNKAFYQLCKHMLPDYHQIEFDVRVYLTQIEEREEIYFTNDLKGEDSI